MTPRAKTALDLALREALQLGHDYVGGEHLLLGLLQQGEGAAVQALVELGADPPALRQKLLDKLGMADGKQRPGLHAEILERLAVAQAAGVAAGGGGLILPCCQDSP
jgi:ATP-dependent Clp protease ATP-binding subunit ClpC